MKILSFKPGHDGHIAYIKDGHLEFSIEAEKDSWPRYDNVTPSLVQRSMNLADQTPDVIALSGWVKGFHSNSDDDEGGYWGFGQNSEKVSKTTIFGKDAHLFSSTHERSHIFCSYALSPFQQGQPCYALVWEGNIGAFYKIDENMEIKKIGTVLEDPGNKYAYLYALADPSFPDGLGNFRFEYAGKLMALASYGSTGDPSPEEAEVIDKILSQKSILLTLDKAEFKSTKYYNVGVESPEFKELARKHSDAIFNKFLTFAKENLTEKLPLIISGGCGLNCDWNSMWKESGLFSDVFVPPCTNDSGSAIGTAAEAQFHFTGSAKLTWSVYSGEEFIMDSTDLSGLEAKKLDLKEVADYINAGNVIGWASGRYEIGPRALGNRSILASPLIKETHQKLNSIKKREGFRPIAPICLEEDVSLNFEYSDPSPHMLYFQMVKHDKLPAITHVDGSARLQSVNSSENPKMHKLLTEFKSISGVGVLCNTSLNFNGTGFINRLSDLKRYAIEHGLDGFVVNDNFYKILSNS